MPTFVNLQTSICILILVLSFIVRFTSRLQFISMSPLFLKIAECIHCSSILIPFTEDLVKHCRLCTGVIRCDKAHNYICFACDYHSYYRDRMRRHVRNHIGEKPFECNICFYRSNENSTIIKHMRKKHKMKLHKLALTGLRLRTND